MSLSESVVGRDFECQTIESILFLSECVRSSTIPDNIEAFSKSSNSKIRYLALRACQGNGELVDKYFRMDDPSSSIRQVMIGRSASLPEIVSSFRDANPGMRVAALEALSKFRISRADQNAFIMDFLSLVNDKEHEVRLLFAKALRRFNKLSDEILVKLFDKEDIGTLIYAAEDEHRDVRAAAVISLRHIIRKKTACDGFDFLMDILNDDSLRVRELTMKSMYMICKKCTITKESKELFGVLVCLREMNPVLKKFLLRIVTRIKYKDVFIVNHLFGTGLEDREILETVKKIVRGNTSIFLDAASANPFMFSKKEDRSLYKVEYLVDLVIIRELMRVADLHISDQVQRDLGLASVRPVSSTSEAAELSKIQGLLASLLLEMPNASSEDIEISDAFRTEMMKIRTITAFGKFIKDYMTGLPLGTINILLVPYKFRFRRRSLRRLIRKHGVCLASDGFRVDAGLISLVKELVDIFMSSPRHLVLNEYSLSLPEAVVRQGDLPVEFEARVDWKIRSKSIFLVLESGDARISYPARSTVHVLLDRCPSSIVCYLACRVLCRQSGLTDQAIMLGITSKTEINIVSP